MENFSILVSIIILLNASVVLVDSSSSSSDSHVHYVNRLTKRGILRGTTEQVLGRNVSIFLGIPFAKPPVGELRFKRPEPFPKWDHIRNATQLPASCYQLIDKSFDRFQGVDMWNPNTERSEDCLYLNVWQPVTTSSSSSKKKAVMVWIYGGSFSTGTSTLELYDARILAAKGDVVVVSMQYRLGPLGFLYLGIPEAPGNQGLLDQQLALQWIRENIDSFDGDPHRVTLFGESAGAFSVSLHLLSPKSKDLVKSGIMQSASAVAPWGLDAPAIAKRKASELAKISKCHSGQDTEIVKCLRGVDAEMFNSNQQRIDDKESVLFTPFVPTIDDFFLEELPIETLKKGKFKQGSILLGVNRDEGFYFLAYLQTHHFDLNASSNVTAVEYREIVSSILDAADKASLIADSVAFEYGAPYFLNESALYRKVLDDIFGDVSFKCPVVDFALYYAKDEVDVYMYNFKHRTSANPWPSWMGVMHGYEIDHVFGMPLNDSLNYTKAEKLLSEKILQYWTNFAKTG